MKNFILTGLCFLMSLNTALASAGTCKLSQLFSNDVGRVTPSQRRVVNREIDRSVILSKPQRSPNKRTALEDSQVTLNKDQFNFLINGEVLAPISEPGVRYFPTAFKAMTKEVSGHATIDVYERPFNAWSPKSHTEDRSVSQLSVKRNILHVEGRPEPVVYYPNIFSLFFEATQKSKSTESFYQDIEIPLSAIHNGLLQEGTFAGSPYPNRAPKLGQSYTYKDGVLTVNKTDGLVYPIVDRYYRQDVITIKIWITQDMTQISRVEVTVMRTQDVVALVPIKRKKLVTAIVAKGPFKIGEFVKPNENMVRVNHIVSKPIQPTEDWLRQVDVNSVPIGQFMTIRDSE